MNTEEMKASRSIYVSGLIRTTCLCAIALLGGGLVLVGFLNGYVMPATQVDAVLSEKELADVPLRRVVERALTQAAIPLWEPWIAVGIPVVTLGILGLLADVMSCRAAPREP